MANARRVYRSDESETGEVIWTSTDVHYGSGGIKGLNHLISFSQTGWVKDDTAPGVSTRTEIFDAVTSRTPVELEATTTGVHKLLLRVPIPIDFGLFPAGSVAILTRLSNVAVGVTLKLTMLRGGVADPGIDAVDVKPALANTYAFFQFTPTDTYSPGDFVTFELEFTSDSIGDKVDVSDAEIFYENDKVNS